MPIAAADDLRGHRSPCPSCGAEVTVPLHAVGPGTMLDEYQLEEQLGVGTMGVVYRGHEFGTQRPVALKVRPLIDGVSGETRAAFVNEMRVLTQLAHPNLVAALSAGEALGHCYLALEFVDGENLDDRLTRRGRLAEHEALSIALKVVLALDYAWETLRITHHDIKPGNIMISKAGEVKLMDLGISVSRYDFGDDEEASDVIVGTPYYMSPEQAVGQPTDWKSDQYSLGATLYHCITGTPPFDGDTCELLIQNVLHAPLAPPAERFPRISPGCAQLLEHMMRKDPAERYPSWVAVRAAVQAALRGEQPDTARRGAGEATIAEISRPAARALVNEATPALAAPNLAQRAAPVPPARRLAPVVVGWLLGGLLLVCILLAWLLWLRGK